EQNERRRLVHPPRVPVDREAPVRQGTGRNADAREVGTRLLDLRRADPRVPFHGPAVHDRVGDRLEAPRDRPRPGRRSRRLPHAAPIARVGRTPQETERMAHAPPEVPPRATSAVCSPAVTHAELRTLVAAYAAGTLEAAAAAWTVVDARRRTAAARSEAAVLTARLAAAERERAALAAELAARTDAV